MSRSFNSAMMPLLLCCFALATAPPRKTVTTAEAISHITNRVDPDVPPIAKAAKVGGKVNVEIVISAAGKVSSVRVISGHPMLRQSAMDAVKQWTFEPFTENKIPVQVVAQVEVDFPDEMSRKEADARQRYYAAEDECRNLITDRNYPNAERACKKAVDLSNELPKEVVLERSIPRALLGNSVYLQGRTPEAIPWYEEALNLDKAYLKPNDADLASDYENLGRAYATTGELRKADDLYALSTSTFEAAIQNLPSMKENYTRRLRRALTEYAQVKEKEGQVAEAEHLRNRAEARH